MVHSTLAIKQWLEVKDSIIYKGLWTQKHHDNVSSTYVETEVFAQQALLAEPKMTFYIFEVC